MRLKNAGGWFDEEKLIVTVDQYSKHVRTESGRGWFEVGSKLTIEVSNSRQKVTVLRAVPHEGESFGVWPEENLTADHGVRLLGALVDGFGRQLIVFLDRASYFYATDVWEFDSVLHQSYRRMTTLHKY
jgi:hypothetical protein